MEVQETKLKGCFIIEPQVFNDNRGYFFESFNQSRFEAAIGQQVDFIQDNQSASTGNVIRGLHFQEGIYAQAKLIRVLSGRILDVAVDIREGSPTYGQWVGVELSEENKKQLFIPRGFAHGFSVLSDGAVVTYKCDNYYHKSADSGIRYDDPSLGIEWGIPEHRRVLSEKDLNLPNLVTNR